MRKFFIFKKKLSFKIIIAFCFFIFSIFFSIVFILDKNSRIITGKVESISKLSDYNETFCEKDFFDSSSTGKINLFRTSFQNWKSDSLPSVISNTIETNNIIVIGHNICENGYCVKPNSGFAKITEINLGDTLNLCLKNRLYKFNAREKKIVNELDFSILNNNFSIKIATFFTSWGKCKNSFCTETLDRFVVVFESF